MDAYGAAKARLFEELGPAARVINVDDAFGAELARRPSAGRLVRVGRADADVAPTDVTVDRRGIRGELSTPDGPVRFESRLVGRHNLYNLMVALAVGVCLDVPAREMAEALSAVDGAPGRLERCDEPGDDIVVLVDYAHTPDALVRVLDASRALTRRRLLCVFGCGGDRDPDKRPKMGAAVGSGADVAVVTNDNPRSEEPAAIARAIEEGLRPTGIPYEVVLDRSEAIRRAVREAEAGDVVLIAGKGHEPYQIIGADRRDFDDRVEARRALAIRRGAS
jgi:UDP-N-acetylmuramoyl-L-alanyl-D-glutamate--2,6-diaminopimelate ligase